ncbi:glycerol kinase [Rhodospirillum rubrum]|uniref:Carbohydrate kinase, FGGY n=1 Tax=Rhodospirillum rubrum (strain ATCC 11170 / ATH 1.1.1 / DSM 467 / LMG 4362 / NCIMB 8255 / S1) TaxID=269796 RepID=Q2RNP0_RHORT|nr:glycerol kinase [Rhodospirillum rubrum]ABC24255.1 Carbohydrate kinase, FGGY [Rhodospirillum rubrum ATCC 11170]AEO50006.1 carbohydrate kinase, FGGY [Rhodospirillum rubrum F11]MBK5955973.1 glycerol kinase [Rhodospirillum rubrum]QXG80187.1 glycerol kinase [Rhodospirillum rubrum]HAQ01064.1 glycerol kinase [Rhodospirillum rubrum]
MNAKARKKMIIRDDLILAIDQGTSGTRALLFDQHGPVHSGGRLALAPTHPRDGWVEIDPEDIWLDVLTAWRQVLEGSGADHVTAIALATQRDTTIVWDRRTGKPVYNAISWLDRRGAARCRELVETGYESLVRVRSGLVVDSAFAATKVAWILENVEGARAAAEAGHLAFGTVDSFLLWRLTGGAVHATDASNASRTMLFNIHSQRWDADLLALFGVPWQMMPEVRDSACVFGHTDRAGFGRPIPIAAMIGDQSAALIGQGCLTPGMIKAGMGASCVMIANTGPTALASRHGLLTSIAYRLDGEVTYALEGTVFSAGAAIGWLSESLGVIERPEITELLARGMKGNRGVYMVPAFSGLGAPYWDPGARGAIFGLSHDTGVPELARAALESVAYQAYDLLEAMIADGLPRPAVLRVEGAMSANDWLLSFLANILEVPVERPAIAETAAMGAALLAGVHLGLYGSLDAAGNAWEGNGRFDPAIDPAYRRQLLDGWRKAVGRVQESAP